MHMKHFDSKSKYSEDDKIKMPELMEDTIFMVLGEIFPTDRRHSSGNRLRPLS